MLVVLATGVAAWWFLWGPGVPQPSAPVEEQPEGPSEQQPPEQQPPPEKEAPHELLETVIFGVHPDYIAELAWRYEDSDGKWAEFSYSVIGEEVIDTTPVKKVEISLTTSEGFTASATVFIDDEGNTLRVELPGGQVLEGFEASFYVSEIVYEALPRVVSLSFFLEPGTVDVQSLGRQDFGGTSLDVTRYTWMPGPGHEVEKVTADVAITESGVRLLVGYRIDYSDGSWAQVTAKSITLA